MALSRRQSSVYNDPDSGLCFSHAINWYFSVCPLFFVCMKVNMVKIVIVFLRNTVGNKFINTMDMYDSVR